MAAPTTPTAEETSFASVKYPAWLMDDAPRPEEEDGLKRSQEPRERVDLLVRMIEDLKKEEGMSLPIKIGELFRRVNGRVRVMVEGEWEGKKVVFGFIEFKAVVRCSDMDADGDGERGLGLLHGGWLGERREGECVRDEEEVVGIIREGMEEGDGGS